MPPASFVRRAFLAAVLALLTASAALAAAPAAQELPDIGTPVDQIITGSDEYKLGAMIIQGLQDQGQIIDDPEINEYIQSVGSRLSSHAQEGNTKFTFFVVNRFRGWPHSGHVTLVRGERSRLADFASETL